MFEHKRDQILPIPRFLGRLAACFGVTAGVVALALAVGVWGYHTLAGLGWVDSLLNAAMILTGMGPVDPMRTVGAKLFASAYALFSGVVFLSAMSITMAPVFHRIMHRIHLAEEDIED